MKTKK